MRRQLTSMALMTVGVLALIFGLAVGPAPTTASARPQLQPSPRPTLQPTPDFTQNTPTPPPATTVPTAPPAPVEETGGNQSVPTPVPPGRVTGTVIDLRTNAPAPNKLVVIGTAVVLTDGNGNYDRWVESGYYRLALQLRSGEGTPTQGGQEIAVGPGDTVTVHLFFTSPAPAALAEPTVAPPVESPVASLPPFDVPGELPDTSAERAAPVARPAGAKPPTHALPSTSAPVQLTTPGMWVLGGALLLAFGVALQLLPRRRRAQQRALLSTLLASAPRSARRNPDELLKDLLDRDM